MEITRRPGYSADRDFARLAHHRAYRALVERQFGAWDEAQQDAFFAAAWAAGVTEIVSADGVPCGYFCVEDREDDVYIHELVLLPEFQGRGIGTQLLREVIEQARQRGIPVRLQALLLNKAARLYRRLGFQETGHTETHILMERP